MTPFRTHSDRSFCRPHMTPWSFRCYHCTPRRLMVCDRLCLGNYPTAKRCEFALFCQPLEKDLQSISYLVASMLVRSHNAFDCSWIGPPNGLYWKRLFQHMHIHSISCKSTWAKASNTHTHPAGTSSSNQNLKWNTTTWHKVTWWEGSMYIRYWCSLCMALRILSSLSRWIVLDMLLAWDCRHHWRLRVKNASHAFVNKIM